jgi:hypothetical protein
MILPAKERVAGDVVSWFRVAALEAIRADQGDRRQKRERATM